MKNFTLLVVTLVVILQFKISATLKSNEEITKVSDWLDKKIEGIKDFLHKLKRGREMSTNCRDAAQDNSNQDRHKDDKKINTLEELEQRKSNVEVVKNETLIDEKVDSKTSINGTPRCAPGETFVNGECRPAE